LNGERGVLTSADVLAGRGSPVQSGERGAVGRVSERERVCVCKEQDSEERKGGMQRTNDNA